MTNDVRMMLYCTMCEKVTRHYLEKHADGEYYDTCSVCKHAYNEEAWEWDDEDDDIDGVFWEE